MPPIDVLRVRVDDIFLPHPPHIIKNEKVWNAVLNKHEIGIKESTYNIPKVFCP